MKNKKVSLAAWNAYDDGDGIQSGWRDKMYFEHRRRLGKVKSKVSDTQQTPRAFSSSISRKTTTFTNKRSREIQLDNNRLLNRLTKIANKTPKKPKSPKKKPKNTTAFNDILKKREISRTNKYLVKRIINTQSSIKHNELKKHWKRHEKIMKNKKISKYMRKHNKPKGLLKYTILKQNELKKLKKKTKFIKKQYTYDENNTINNTNNINNNTININGNNIDFDTLYALNNLTLNTSENTSTLNTTRIQSLLNTNRSTKSQQNYPYNNRSTNKTNIYTNNDTNNDTNNNSFKENQKYCNNINESKLNKFNEEFKNDDIDEIPSDWENDIEWNKKELYNDKKNSKRPSKIIRLPTIS